MTLGLPAGVGYTLTASALASDGITTCSGTTPFDVTDTISRLIVHLVCRVPAQAGILSATANINVCPIIDGLSANPAEVVVGSTVALAVTAHDADGTPSPPAYTWSASAGSRRRTPRSPAPRRESPPSPSPCRTETQTASIA